MANTARLLSPTSAVSMVIAEAQIAHCQRRRKNVQSGTSSKQNCTEPVNTLS